MKCFYHHDADAVGLCKACQKGLCPSCAVDVGNGLACRDACEEQVRIVNQLVDRNIRLSPASEAVLGKQPRAFLATGAFQLLAGAVFGLLGQGMDGMFRVGITAVGVLLAISGAWQIVYGLGLRGDTGKLR